ncbi:cupin superfamily acireductone dioxygenase involved in methionine salvage [Pedobacter sp. UYP30]|uniref:ABC transporter substrate-binding protein n=1 Tax=Pedobacter sp. UYP30 TaxID=1756400 RepID=UPI003392738C
MKFKLIYVLFIVASMLFAGCSSKIRPTKKTKTPQTTKETEKATEDSNDKKPSKKRFTEANVSLLIPFGLNRINLKTATKADVERHAMPIDFYQGFNMGIDSAATFGLSFKLNVFDTEDDQAHIATLVKNQGFINSDLIVGPVFPKEIKAVTEYSITHHATIISPLAASNPVDFNNPNLVSIASSLDQHATKLAEYISKHYEPANTIVVLINTKKTADENFAAPIRNFFKQASGSRFILQEYPSTYAFERNMVKGKKYAVVVTSADRAFVLPTIEKLFRLKNNPRTKYDINLFGHPVWLKQNYPIDQLENLNTILTSSYKIDYKSSSVVKFIKGYRARYGFEPGEYAFKGFDVGFYVGRLLAKHGADYREYITKDSYKGLHNSFNFVYNPKTGYVNTHVMLLRYHNFSLEVVN